MAVVEVATEVRDNLAATITVDEAVDLEAEVVMITAIATLEAIVVEEIIGGKTVAAVVMVEVAMEVIRVVVEVNHTEEMVGETAVVDTTTAAVEAGTTIVEEVEDIMIAEEEVDMVLRKILRVSMEMNGPTLE